VQRQRSHSCAATAPDPALQAQASPVPGRTELALRKLRIRDPALLLRAAVIDQTARNLVAEATTKARIATAPPPEAGQPISEKAPGPPERPAKARR